MNGGGDTRRRCERLASIVRLAIGIGQAGDQREAVLFLKELDRLVEEPLDVLAPDVGQIIACKITAGLAMRPAIRHLRVGVDPV